MLVLNRKDIFLRKSQADVTGSIPSPIQTFQGYTFIVRAILFSGQISGLVLDISHCESQFY